ncbi:MAG: hypothetical protein ABI723_19765 [Bacteroidia bacterium]
MSFNRWGGDVARFSPGTSYKLALSGETNDLLPLLTLLFVLLIALAGRGGISKSSISILFLAVVFDEGFIGFIFIR